MGGVDGTGKPLSAVDGQHAIGVGEDRGEKNPFDRWLMQKLHGVFDAISQEPLPPDLLNLVRQLEAKEKAADAQLHLNFDKRSYGSSA
jgi:hypothetical protein